MEPGIHLEGDWEGAREEPRDIMGPNRNWVLPVREGPPSFDLHSAALFIPPPTPCSSLGVLCRAGSQPTPYRA